MLTKSQLYYNLRLENDSNHQSKLEKIEGMVLSQSNWGWSLQSDGNDRDKRLIIMRMRRGPKTA